MKFFFQSLQYLRPYRRGALFNILFNLLATVFTISSFVILKPFLDILFSDMQAYKEQLAPEGSLSIASYIAQFNAWLVSYIEANGKQAGLLAVCAIVSMSFFFKNLFRYLALYVMAPVRNGIERDLRKKLFDKLLLLPLSYFSEERKGDLLARFSSDVQEIQWSVLRSLETLIRSPLAILGSLGVMLYISPLLTLFSLLLILFVGLIIGRVSKSLRKNSEDAQATQGRMLSQLEEALGGLRILQVFSAEHYQKEKFSQENDGYFSLMNRIRRRQELSSPLTEFLGVTVVLILLWFGGSLVFSGHFQASTFLTFVLMFYNLIDPAKSFAAAYYDIQKGAASAKRLNEVFDAPLRIEDAPQAQPIHSIEEGIELRELSFEYSPGHTVLHEINLKIPKGQTVALLGSSGAGKSTIADLVPRLYDCSSGGIYIDGKDIRKLRLADLRGLMGLVSQEAVLFNDTIYNNIAFGWPHATQEAVEEAAKLAYAHNFIMATEAGYQSLIGDRGTKLSGGQRQRLTLARALLRDPQLLILDEATSALDSESEKAIQEALDQVLEKRTALVIAHRLSTIRKADQIVVLEKGRIVELGKHEELLQSQGLYTRWVSLQNMNKQEDQDET